MCQRRWLVIRRALIGFSIAAGWINSPVTVNAEEPNNPLKGTSWIIEVSELNFSSKSTVSFRDVLQFDSETVTYSHLLSEGHPPATFTLSVNDGGVVVWESMQALNNYKLVLFWRGKVQGETMEGIFTRQALGAPLRSFSFSGELLTTPRGDRALSTIRTPSIPVGEDDVVTQIEEDGRNPSYQPVSHNNAFDSTQDHPTPPLVHYPARGGINGGVIDELPKDQHFLEAAEHPLTLPRDHAVESEHPQIAQIPSGRANADPSHQVTAITPPQQSVAPLEREWWRARVELDQSQEEPHENRRTQAITLEVLNILQQKLRTSQNTNMYLTKNLADLYYSLGVLFSKNMEYTKATAAFREAIELKPDDGEAHHNLGVIYAEYLPDHQKAIRHFRRYLEITPTGPEAGRVRRYLASWLASEAQADFK